MPLVQIHTNKRVINPSNLLSGLSSLVVSILDKPEEYVMVQLKDEESMLFAGTSEPLVYLELKSIGLPKDRTQEMSKRLCEFIEESLQIDKTRVYIEFTDATRSMWGWNGTTFER